MANLNSETITIGDLFGQDFFFSIPNYQRPFSWDRDQLADLVDDLVGANRDSDYFLGTLVLHETAERTFDVVDGQQRLTALSILLACLRDLLEADDDEVQELLVQPEKKFKGIPARVRLAVRDSGPYEKIVSTRGGTANIDPEGALQTNPERRYREAVTVFREALGQRSQAELRSLIEFLIQHVVVIFLAAATFDDAFRLFTVVNDRGKQLRRIDVLKAVNLSPAVISDEGLREEHARKWEDYEETLGEIEFESLFHAMRLIFVQDKPEGDLLHEFQQRIFGKVGRPVPGTSFITSLGTYVDLYEALFISREYLAATEHEAKFKTLMFSMVNEFRASEWKACILAYAKKFGVNGLMDFLLAVESLYVSHWVGGIRKDERYSSYTEILRDIERSKTGAAVTQAIEVDLSPIRAACRKDNFYGAGYAKYLLVRAEIQAAELIHAREFSPRSIEHVLPQNPKVGSAWRSSFPDDDMRDLVHTVGNLVLLSKAKNSSAQNKDFTDKKRTYLQPRVSDYPRSLAVLAVQEWTPEVVRERTEQFANEVLSPV